MDERIELDSILAGIINITEPDGDRHIYFNPPPSVRMKYPAIRYSLGNINTDFANNRTYRTVPSFEVTLIDENPDTEFLKPILDIPYCSFNRFYKADNLNHWVFIIHNN